VQDGEEGKLSWFGRTGSSAHLALPPTGFPFSHVAERWALLLLVGDCTKVRWFSPKCGPFNPWEACMAETDSSMVCFFAFWGVFVLIYLAKSLHAWFSPMIFGIWEFY
jgi:hypothetical protein